MLKAYLILLVLSSISMGGQERHGGDLAAIHVRKLGKLFYETYVKTDRLPVSLTQEEKSRMRSKIFGMPLFSISKPNFPGLYTVSQFPKFAILLNREIALRAKLLLVGKMYLNLVGKDLLIPFSESLSTERYEKKSDVSARQLKQLFISILLNSPLKNNTKVLFNLYLTNFESTLGPVFDGYFEYATDFMLEPGGTNGFYILKFDPSRIHSGTIRHPSFKYLVSHELLNTFGDGRDYLYEKSIE